MFRCWDVISQGGRFAEGTFDDLELPVTPETVVEVTFVVGYYRFLALLINSLGHVDS